MGNILLQTILSMFCVRSPNYHTYLKNNESILKKIEKLKDGHKISGGQVVLELKQYFAYFRTTRGGFLSATHSTLFSLDHHVGVNLQHYRILNFDTIRCKV